MIGIIVMSTTLEQLGALLALLVVICTVPFTCAEVDEAKAHFLVGQVVVEWSTMVDVG